ncbi:MAG: SH3 domain-containing protein [Gloeotrichia echinulata GP01]
MVSGLLKFILGFLMAIAILIGGGVVVALYFINRTAIAPPKPVFVNDNPPTKTNAPTQKPSQPTPTSTPKASATPTPTPSPTTTESPKSLPPGAYQGRVSWSEGLGLRAEPKQDAQRVGGVAFNQKIIILEESDDKAWQKIRVEGTNQEGWVKAGNTERSEQQNDAQQPEKPPQQQ